MFKALMEKWHSHIYYLLQVRQGPRRVKMAPFLVEIGQFLNEIKHHSFGMKIKIRCCSTTKHIQMQSNTLYFCSKTMRIYIKFVIYVHYTSTYTCKLLC